MSGTLINSEDLDFSQAATVRPSADENSMRFVLPIPVITENTEDFINPETGDPLTDWRGNKIEGNGIVFLMAKINHGRPLKQMGKRSYLLTKYRVNKQRR